MCENTIFTNHKKIPKVAPNAIQDSQNDPQGSKNDPPDPQNEQKDGASTFSNAGKTLRRDGEMVVPRLTCLMCCLSSLPV